MTAAEYVAEIVATAPPLSTEAVQRLAGLLPAPVRVGDVLPDVLRDLGAPDHVLDQLADDA